LLLSPHPEGQLLSAIDLVNRCSGHSSLSPSIVKGFFVCALRRISTERILGKSDNRRGEHHMDTRKQNLDKSALRFNQISIITLVLIGYILDQPVLPAIVAVVLLAGSISPRFALFKLTYRHVIKPLGIMRPDPVDDIPAPHEFAQLLGGIVLGIGVYFLITGFSVLGWGLAWVVVLLAAANVFLGFCAGCFVYYQLGKLGVPGFRPKEGTSV
jgi:hypothetical protein